MPLSPNFPAARSRFFVRQRLAPSSKFLKPSAILCRMHALDFGPQCARSGRQNRRHQFRRRARGLAQVASLACAFAASGSITHAQGGLSAGNGSAATSLKQHYDSAHNFQSLGDMAQAAGEYKAFLTEALSALGESHAAAGDAADAIPLFEEAMKITPDDLNLRIRYAEACRRANDLARAKAVAEAAVAAAPKSAKARVELGQVLLAMKENGAAVGQFEEAVALQPDFNNGYMLATAYLHKKDEEHA